MDSLPYSIFVRPCVRRVSGLQNDTIAIAHIDAIGRHRFAARVLPLEDMVAEASLWAIRTDMTFEYVTDMQGIVKPTGIGTGLFFPYSPRPPIWRGKAP